MEALIAVYFMVQFMLPLSIVVWLGVKFNKVHKRSSLLEGKRKAILQRRGLFDFISPFIVLLAVLVYFLFAAFVIYIQRDPFPGFAGYLTLGIVTLGYAVQALIVYAVLYGRKANPFETHEGRARTIGLTVKSCVYSCIACVVFLSLNLTLVLLDLQRWEPFALSVFFVICALLGSMGLRRAAAQARSGWARNLAAFARAAIYAPGQRDIGPVDRLTLQSEVTGLTGPLRDHNDKVAAERCRLVLQIVARTRLEIRVRRVLSGEGIALASSHVTEPLAFAGRFHVGDANQLGARFQRDSGTTRCEHECENRRPSHGVLPARSAGRFCTPPT